MNDPHPLATLSPAEQTLMDLIWRLQPVSIGSLLESVNGRRIKPILRSTLQTQLYRLEAKGWLRGQGRSHAKHYEATITEHDGRARLLTELTQRLFGGSGVAVLRCLIDSGTLSDRELQDLGQTIRDHQHPKHVPPPHPRQ